MDRSSLDKKFLWRFWDWLRLLNCDSCIVSTMKMKNCFQENCRLDLFYLVSSPEVMVYFYNSPIRPSVEYCCHIWTGVSNFFGDICNKLQRQVCRVVNLILNASFKPLAHCQIVASLIVLIGSSTLEDASQNWLNCFPPYFCKVFSLFWFSFHI